MEKISFADCVKSDEASFTVKEEGIT